MLKPRLNFTLRFIKVILQSLILLYRMKTKPTKPPKTIEDYNKLIIKYRKEFEALKILRATLKRI